MPKAHKQTIRISCLLILLFVPSIPYVLANTGAVHLSNAYDYRSVTYNTYVKWGGDLYGDSVDYGLGSDSHINFTDFSMGSADNPSWTFGVVSQNGNVTISAIQTNYVRLSAVTKTSETLNVTFYYISLPAEVDIAQPTNTSILSSSYYTTYSAWVAAVAPAVYNNAESNYLMVKSAYSTPVIQILQTTISSTGGGTSYTDTNSTTQSSITTSTSSAETVSTSISTVSSSVCTPSAASSTSTSSTPGAFALTISPSTGTVVQGAFIPTQIYVSSPGHTAGMVSLSVSNPIPGARIAIIPLSGVANYSSSMTIATSSATPPGTYCIQVTGAEGQSIKTAAFVLVVAPLGQNGSEPMPNYTLVLIVAVVAVSLVAVVASGAPRRINLRRRRYRKNTSTGM